MSEYLGYIVWYTVKTAQKTAQDETTLDVGPEQLEKWFADLDLDRAYLPRPPKSIDAFRTATMVTGEPYRSDDGLRYQLSVMETKKESDLIVRVVMRRALDPGAVTTRVADLKYFRARRTTAGRVHGSEDVKTRIHAGLEGIDLKVVTDFVDACMKQYERDCRQLTPHKVRALLRSYLTDLRGVPLAYGTFFVPATALEQVRALQAFVSRLGAASRMRLIPLIDEEEQRNMLQEAIDSEVDERARQALSEISQWQDDHPEKTPGEWTLSAWYDRCRYLQNLLVGYGEEYGMTFPTAADSLESLLEATRRLARRVMTATRRS